MALHGPASMRDGGIKIFRENSLWVTATGVFHGNLIHHIAWSLPSRNTSQQIIQGNEVRKSWVSCIEALHNVMPAIIKNLRPLRTSYEDLGKPKVALNELSADWNINLNFF